MTPQKYPEELLRPLVEGYWKRNIPCNVILAALKNRHKISISRRTLLRRCKDWGLDDEAQEDNVEAENNPAPVHRQREANHPAREANHPATSNSRRPVGKRPNQESTGSSSPPVHRQSEGNQLRGKENTANSRRPDVPSGKRPGQESTSDPAPAHRQNEANRPREEDNATTNSRRPVPSGKRPPSSNQESSRRLKPFQDDRLVRSDDETKQEITTKVIARPKSFFENDIFDFVDSLERKPKTPAPLDLDSVQQVDLFDSNDGGGEKVPPATSSSPPARKHTIDVDTPLSTETHLLELQLELKRLRAEKEEMAQESIRNKQNAETWRKLLDEARIRNEIGEALRETQRDEMEALKSKSNALFETVQQLQKSKVLDEARIRNEIGEALRETQRDEMEALKSKSNALFETVQQLQKTKLLDEARIRSETRDALRETQRDEMEALKTKSNSLSETVRQLQKTLLAKNEKISEGNEELQKQRMECERANQKLQQSQKVIHILKQELEASKFATNQAVNALKTLQDKSLREYATLKQKNDSQREWISKYKNLINGRIGFREENPASQPKTTDVVVKTVNHVATTTTTLPPVDDRSTSQNRPTETGSSVDGTGVVAAETTPPHTFVCRVENCKFVCPDSDSYRSHLKEHLQRIALDNQST